MEQEKGFKVQDKRSSSQNSQEKSPEAATIETQTTTNPEQSQEPKQEPSVPEYDAASAQLPEASFMTLIISLAFPVQMSLGLIPDPMTQQVRKDLEQAKFHIDLLGILREKTQGNLTEEEDQAFEQVLFDLRMAYVEVSK